MEKNSQSLLNPSTIPEVDSISSDLQATSQPTCVVCMSNLRSLTLIPCGHMAVCQSCCWRLQQCPVCRAVIRGVIRTYVWLTWDLQSFQSIHWPYFASPPPRCRFRLLTHMCFIYVVWDVWTCNTSWTSFIWFRLQQFVNFNSSNFLAVKV